MTQSSKLPFEPLMTLQQVAEILNCSLKTVKRRVQSGDLPVLRDGRMVRVHPDDLSRYLKIRREM